MRKPLSTKNMSTPRNPPAKIGWPSRNAGNGTATRGSRPLLGCRRARVGSRIAERSPGSPPSSRRARGDGWHPAPPRCPIRRGPSICPGFLRRLAGCYRGGTRSPDRRCRPANAAAGPRPARLCRETAGHEGDRPREVSRSAGPDALARAPRHERRPVAGCAPPVRVRSGELVLQSGGTLADRDVGRGPHRRMVDAVRTAALAARSLPAAPCTSWTARRYTRSTGKAGNRPGRCRSEVRPGYWARWRTASST